MYNTVNWKYNEYVSSKQPLALGKGAFVQGENIGVCSGDLGAHQQKAHKTIYTWELELTFFSFEQVSSQPTTKIDHRYCFMK